MPLITDPVGVNNSPNSHNGDNVDRRQLSALYAAFHECAAAWRRGEARAADVRRAEAAVVAAGGDRAPRGQLPPEPPAVIRQRRRELAVRRAVGAKLRRRRRLTPAQRNRLEDRAVVAVFGRSVCIPSREMGSPMRHTPAPRTSRRARSARVRRSVRCARSPDGPPPGGADPHDLGRENRKSPSPNACQHGNGLFDNECNSDRTLPSARPQTTPGLEMTA